MMFGESARLDDVPVEGCTHTAVLRELVPLFEEEGAHRIEQGIVGAIHRKRVIRRCQLTARGLQALRGFGPPIANCLGFRSFAPHMGIPRFSIASWIGIAEARP
jgi:hypothetical protein